MINSESYLPQAITWINEAVGEVLDSDTNIVLGPVEHSNQKAMFADSLIQLEIAKQLTRLSNSLDQLVRAQHR